MTPLQVFWASRYGKGYGRAQIAALQQRGFARLRHKVMPRSPFYAEFAARPFETWPIMTKAGLMAHFSTINTRGLARDQALALALAAERSRDFSPLIDGVALGLSTGTSGQRGLFASDRRERALWAALMLGRFMPSLLRRQRVAFFLRANNPLYESLNNPLICFQFYDLLQAFDPHIARLNLQNPTVLIAPAQILGFLAQVQLAGRLQIAPHCVIAVAEVASPEDSALVTRAFGRPLDQVYQCTEGVLGMTCRAGSLHLNEDFLFIEREILDPATGAFVPIITDLARRSLPILRYRLDDVLVPDPRPCPCGCSRLRLARIEGRCDDILYWPTAEGERRMIPSDAIRQAMAASLAPIRDYRVEQVSPQDLRIALDSDTFDAASREVSAALARQAERYGVVLPQLCFTQGVPQQLDAKRRRVINRQAGARI